MNNTLIYAVTCLIFLLNHVSYALSYDEYLKVHEINTQTYNLIEGQNYDEALVKAEESIKLDNDYERNSVPYYYKATSYKSLGRFNESIDCLEVIVRHFIDKNDPRLWSIYKELGICCGRATLYDKGEEYYSIAYLIHQDDQLLNNYAWLIGTAPKLTNRKSELGLKMAIKSCENTQFNNFAYLDALAACYGDNEQFDKAIEIQRKAIALVGDKKSFDFNLRLKLYQKKIKYRQDMDLDTIMKLLNPNDRM